jgi:hypothetical protein
MKKVLFIVLLCITSFAFFTPKFSDFSTEILTLLEKHYTKYPMENIYIQTDKSYYVTSEKIWFKAIIRYEDTLFVDSLSKVLYVELLNSEHKIVTQRTLQLINNTTFGDITLSDSLAAGNYELRAYTSWLRNFGEETFYHKTLNIFQATTTKDLENNSQNNTNTLQKSTSNKNTNLAIKPILQFFPEGGDMVKLLRNHIAFKATDSTGQGIFVEGIIQDEQGKRWANFKSNELGLGSFRIVPLGNTLIARVFLANGDTANYKLPTALEKGLLLGIKEQTEDSLKILLQDNLPSFENGKQNYCLLAQSAGKVVFMAKTSLKRAAQIVAISTQNIPTGILHISLIDENKIPHCERLVFINHNDMIDIDLKTIKNTYAPREKIQIDITTHLQASTNTKKAINSEISVLVVDSHLVKKQEYEENILTKLLLTSDLRGKIENPAYFLLNTEQSKQDLDYLMMTQGWRRFKWRELLNETPQNFTHKIEQGLVVSGTVVDSDRKQTPIKNGTVHLFLDNDIKNLFPTKTDKEGKFMISGFNFTDSMAVFLVALGEGKYEYVKLSLDKQIPCASTYAPIINTINFDKAAYMAAMLENQAFMKSFYFDKKTTVLKEVEVVAKKSTVPEYKKGTGAIHLSADAVIQGDDVFQNYAGQNVLFALQGRIPSVNVYGSGFSPNISIRNRSVSPLFLYDGMIVDADFFNGISASDIAAIEVLKSAASASIYGSRALGGVVAVYSKKGDARYKSNPSNKVRTKINGFYAAQEFFNPNYDTLKMPNSDTRTTIYWNPRVKTDNFGKATVTFFAADLPTNYKVIVEGIAQKGLILGRKEYEIVITK